MIEIKGLYKSFDDKTVLSDINADFANGKTNLIIGQSGSGKTVLMKCIVGLLTPEKGEVLYDACRMSWEELRLLRFCPRCWLDLLSICCKILKS